MIGNVYGKWTVVRGPYGQHRQYFCVCECGISKLVREQHLMSGNSRGCLSCRWEFGPRFAHVPKPVLVKLLHVVDHAISRCTDSSKEKYECYGARGIEVRFCDRMSFLEYLLTLSGHDDFSLVVDRINNDGHYEIGNIRFTTHKESASNKRPQKSDERYYREYGFARCFRWLRSKRVSIRMIGELYGTSYGMILRCTNG